MSVECEAAGKRIEVEERARKGGFERRDDCFSNGRGVNMGRVGIEKETRLHVGEGEGGEVPTCEMNKLKSLCVCFC